MVRIPCHKPLISKKNRKVRLYFVTANGPGDLGSIPDRVIPKTQKMVLDASLLNTQHYKVRIKGKVKQSRERSSALPYTLVCCILTRIHMQTTQYKYTSENRRTLCCSNTNRLLILTSILQYEQRNNS